jgi:hypothetical protein
MRIATGHSHAHRNAFKVFNLPAIPWSAQVDSRQVVRHRFVPSSVGQSYDCGMSPLHDRSILFADRYLGQSDRSRCSQTLWRWSMCESYHERDVQAG